MTALVEKGRFGDNENRRPVVQLKAVHLRKYQLNEGAAWMRS